MALCHSLTNTLYWFEDFFLKLGFFADFLNIVSTGGNSIEMVRGEGVAKRPF
jgi:hypothetical protein